jgi:hypothetical protein
MGYIDSGEMQLTTPPFHGTNNGYVLDCNTYHFKYEGYILRNNRPEIIDFRLPKISIFSDKTLFGCCSFPMPKY